MGFLCKNKGNQTQVSIKDINDKELKRDLGLSNIYNVNTTTNFCFEGFDGPMFNMSGATKPMTGLTVGCTGTPTTCSNVYNLTEIDDFTLTFNLSGSTDYTGYTGSFCYKMFGRGSYLISDPLNLEPPRFLNSVEPIREQCYAFSGITGNTIVENIPISSFPVSDNDVMIRTYYEFESKECNPGQIYNTWNNVTQINEFNFEADWYFITTVSPPTPELVRNPIDPLEQVSLVQQPFNPDGIATSIPLRSNPIGGDVMFFINGILLTKGVDWVLEYENYPRTPPVARLLRGNMGTKDVVKLVYLIGPSAEKQINGQQRNDLFKIDQFEVTGITTDVTASTVNIVNVNTTVTPNTQEIYLTREYNEIDNINVFVNGVSLIEGVEFFRSRSSQNRLILNPYHTSIKKGDIIAIWYFQERDVYGGDLGTLETDSATIRWIIPTTLTQPAINNAQFIVQVKEQDDDWDTLYSSDVVEYISDSVNYNFVIENLDLRKRYNYRIVFEKTYVSQLNNDVITRTYSIDGKFDTMDDSLAFSY